MSREGQELDNKSLRYVLDRIAKDIDGLAGDCVGFANAMGGMILIGIEDGQSLPPAKQTIPDDLPERLSKRLSQITSNVAVVPRKLTASNGGEYVEVKVLRSQSSIASMTNGRFFLRVSDETKPLTPDDLSRLISDRNVFIWELAQRRVPRERIDRRKLDDFIIQIRLSDRVSNFIKQKTEEEIIDHYFFANGPFLTNLGVLWIGYREDRAALLYPPTIQCIKYDERGGKIRKQIWGYEYDINPLEMINAVWQEVPDWREGQELPDGLFRKNVPHYDEIVIRELVANALVHRLYSQRGDIFINLYPDRLEIHNPGLLPIGVTPRNILHTSIKRNQHLAKVFYDLKMMEGEGSGFDQMYDVLLTSGKLVPEVREGDDRVTVIIQKRIVNTKIVDFVINANDLFQLSIKERITLGLIAQHESLTAIQLMRLLELNNANDLRHWIGRLLEIGIVKDKGRTRGKEYYIEPEMLRKLDFQGKTTLKRIEKHRLSELILKDLEIYRRSKIGEIHARIGLEIPQRKVRDILRQLVESGQIGKQGDFRHTVYLWTKNS